MRTSFATRLHLTICLPSPLPHYFLLQPTQQPSTEPSSTPTSAPSSLPTSRPSPPPSPLPTPAPSSPSPSPTAPRVVTCTQGQGKPGSCGWSTTPIYCDIHTEISGNLGCWQNVGYSTCIIGVTCDPMLVSSSGAIGGTCSSHGCS